MSFNAASAISSLSAATAAISSRRLRTRSVFSGRWSLATPIGRCQGTSAAVITACTPGSAFAALVSIETMRACTCGRAQDLRVQRPGTSRSWI